MFIVTTVVAVKGSGAEGVIPKARRGRPPREKELSPDFMPIEVFEKRSGLSREQTFSLIEKGRLTPAIRRGYFFVKNNISIDSCRMLVNGSDSSSERYRRQ